jgi:hypothetical protein
VATWSDPAERDAALTCDWQTFSAAYPARSWDSWRKFRKRVQAAAFDDDRLAEIEAVAREAAAREAANVFRERVDHRKAQLIDAAIARDVARAVDEQARHEEVLRALREEMARVPVIDVPPLERIASKHTPETFVLVVSDAHVGKLVREEFVGEGFRYDVTTFRERLARLEAQVLSIAAIHEHAYPLDRLVMMFLGDMVDGVDMRRGHGLRVEVQSAVKQAMIVSTEFAAFTARLRAARPWSIWTDWLYGNHGRVGEYGVALPTDNWDHVAALMFEQAVRDVPDVSVRVRTQKFDVLQLGPLRTYASHGDGATKGDGGFGGIPFYGITRAAAKDAGLHGQQFDLYLAGHYHQRVDMPWGSSRILVNGCWDGGDDFSVNGLKLANTPEQTAFGVHPRRGLTWQYGIQVADRRAATPVLDIPA